MGSCQSVPSATAEAAVGKRPQPPISSTTQKMSQETIGTSRGCSSDTEGSETKILTDHGKTTLISTATSPRTVMANTDDHDNNKNIGTTQLVALNTNSTDKERTDKYKYRPGYSSGGSSFVDSSEEEDDAAATAAARALASSSATRHDRLVEWKQELANGNLTQTIVRIETDFGRDIEDVYEGVHDGPILGTGVAGVVRKVKHRDSGVYFAVKVLNLGLIESEEVLEALREEIFIMCQLDHPNILRLEEVYESETQIFLIQELCSGGDLFDRLEEQPDYHYSEVQCAKLVKQMLSAVRYLHGHKIVHRDLKLENFLFDTESSENLKMIDFGLSKHFKSYGSVHHDAVGTPYAVAPEIIKGSYNEKVDIWSMGVITYLLLSGDSPFGGVDGEPLLRVRDNILKCELSFEPKDIWDEVSVEGKNFVRRLLTEDPDLRPTARDAQRDEWLLVYANMDVEDSKALSSGLVDNLLQFKDYSEMHRVLLEVLSFTLLPEQIHKLKAEFQKVDPDGDGEITLEELKEVLLNRAESGSLGSLSEQEVEDIFNALRVNESETTIRWHEFIAAGLSQCDFDDRNLRLAFDRLDYDRKGHITFDDLSEMLSTSDGRMDSTILKMWHDGLKEIRCKGKDKITFEEFQRFLKGQAPQDAMLKAVKKGECTRKVSRNLLHSTFALQPVPEGSPSARMSRNSDNSISMRNSTHHYRSSARSKTRRTASLSLSPAANSMVENGDDDYDLPYEQDTEQASFGGDAGGLEPDAYRKRQDFRTSVLEASRLFDQMRQARQPINTANPAGLTMVAGGRTPSNGYVASERLAAASKRSGRRNRKNRMKTKSDLSMFLQ